MFQSFFTTYPPDAPNLHPVSSRYKDSQLLGELSPQDTEWLCASGFVTETQTWYTMCDDGSSLMCQVIHSSVGPWFPQIQFTFKLYNGKTKQSTWRSLNVTNFVTPPPGLDKRSSAADQFSVTHKAESDGSESYLINAKLDAQLQVSLAITRPSTIPGYKIGNDDKAGYSYFGYDTANPDGYVIHRFWPRFMAEGHVITGGQATPVQGPGMFVHAIQGMRPNLVACRWNFAHFQSTSREGGVSAIQMEFTSTEEHGTKGKGKGNVSVNIGSLMVDGKLAAVTAETKLPDTPLPPADSVSVVSRAMHHNPVKDKDTSYPMPTSLSFEWAGPSLVQDQSGTFRAKTTSDVGDLQNPKGLIEKVDVLAEIPTLVKTALSYVAGTKPYIYQWYNPATLEIVDPQGKKIEVQGDIYLEATFISDK